MNEPRTHWTISQEKCWRKICEACHPASSRHPSYKRLKKEAEISFAVTLCQFPLWIKSCEIILNEIFKRNLKHFVLWWHKKFYSLKFLPKISQYQSIDTSSQYWIIPFSYPFLKHNKRVLKKAHTLFPSQCGGDIEFEDGGKSAWNMIYICICVSVLFSNYNVDVSPTCRKFMLFLPSCSILSSFSLHCLSTLEIFKKIASGDVFQAIVSDKNVM